MLTLINNHTDDNTPPPLYHGSNIDVVLLPNPAYDVDVRDDVISSRHNPSYTPDDEDEYECMQPNIQHSSQDKVSHDCKMEANPSYGVTTRRGNPHNGSNASEDEQYH